VNTTKIVVTGGWLADGQMAEIVRRTPIGNPLGFQFGIGWVRLQRQIVNPQTASVLNDMGFQLWFADIPTIREVDGHLGDKTIGAWTLEADALAMKAGQA
jgi:hypothetical protein